MNINFIARKTEYGIWEFDHEHQNTVAEALCNGTELVLDEYFRIGMKRDPKPQDQIEVYVSTEYFKDSDTVLTFQSTNDQGTTYLDMFLSKVVWLCPWLQSYFGYKPSELYVKLKPVNSDYISDEQLDEILEGITEEELTQYVNSSYTNGGYL